jgi:hypothetical protein
METPFLGRMEPVWDTYDRGTAGPILIEQVSGKAHYRTHLSRLSQLPELTRLRGDDEKETTDREEHTATTFLALGTRIAESLQRSHWRSELGRAMPEHDVDLEHGSEVSGLDPPL